MKRKEPTFADDERLERKRKSARESMRRWRAANRGISREIERQRNVRRAAEKAIYNREYRKRNRDKHLERCRAWLDKNRERNKQGCRQRYKKRVEDLLQSGQLKAFRKQQSLLNKKWKVQNPDALRRWQAERRARLIGATIGSKEAIAAFYYHIQSSPRLRCYYCKKMTKKAKRHVDHIIPLSKGGSHGIGNLCCACADCNLKKSTSSADELTGQTVMVWS